VLDILYSAKERDLKWEQVDAFSFADEVAKAVESKIQSQGIEFVRNFDVPVGQFTIDPGYVHSALINILENAVDACLKDPGKPAQRIVFGVQEDKTHIIFTVQDNGIGMDEATKEKLFTLFFSSKARKGTGLGLFISHKIIQQHGGTISVQSKPACGATFKVRIPKMSEKAIGDRQSAVPVCRK
jgi:signal transduction histidine kinase